VTLFFLVIFAQFISNVLIHLGFIVSRRIDQSRPLDIPFETEAELRVRGTARTPDVLLSIPLGIRVRRRMPDVSSRRNLFFTTDNEGGEVNDDEFAKEIKTSPAPKRRGAVDDYLKDDDEYVWKSICWIDSKVRADGGFLFYFSTWERCIILNLGT
jgi:hypothetical protein